MEKNTPPKYAFELKTDISYYSGSGTGHVLLTLWSWDAPKHETKGISTYDERFPFPGTLTISCQLSSENFADGAPYAWKTTLRDAYEIDLEDAEKMTTSLKKIERFLKKKENTDGRAESFPVYALRAMQALGVTLLVSEGPKKQHEDTTPNDVLYRIGDAISEIQEKLNPKKENQSAA